MANDYSAYLNRYPDLKAAFGSDVAAARKHYEEYGKNEGRDASISGSDNATDFDLNRFQELLMKFMAMVKITLELLLILQIKQQ